MHPEVKSKSAGSCPKCGMNLKLQSASQASASQTRYGAKYFPNFELTTQDGKTVRFYDDLLKDKLVAIDLIYTTCKYNCPVETALAHARLAGIPAERIAPEEYRAAVIMVLERGGGFARPALVTEVRSVLGFARTGATLDEAIGSVLDAMLADGVLGEGSTGVRLR